MPPLETRTDSPGETPKVPQNPYQYWRGMLRFRLQLHTRSYAPALTGEESPESPEQLAWGLAFPEATRAGPEVPVVSREHLPQLEKIQELLPSRRDEAHFRRGVSRLITPKLVTSKGSFTHLLQLKKFPDIPVSTREEA